MQIQLIDFHAQEHKKNTESPKAGKMRSWWLIVVAITATQSVWAQSEIVESERPRTVYFLVDVSGSMKTRFDEAEQEITSRLAEISASEPDTLVSRTEFRAEIEQ